MKRFLTRPLRLAFFLLLAAILLTRSVLPPGDPVERVRAYTRQIEFDFVVWTLDALGLKLGQTALGTSQYLTAAEGRQVVLDYLALIGQIQQTEAQIDAIYADPAQHNPQSAAAGLSAQLAALTARRANLEPLAEAVLERQVSLTAAELALTLGGQPLPPVLYHVTPPPAALIVSPRTVIRQDADISIDPSLTLEQVVALEQQVDQNLDVSSLVVGIGGIGLYPTMVMETTDLNWLAEVVAHEWVHNFLTLRPLGVSYMNSPELRIMNETAASLAGKELGAAVIARFYPEFVPAPAAPAPPPSDPAPTPQPPAFSFQAEMHTTRVAVDALLADGKVVEAETYMEQRRQLFWEQGYRLRKLNQAYFAFYGAYADQPGGAAGADPVGAAVRGLRQRSRSLAQFLNTISWYASWEDFKNASVTAGETQP
jgi:hypothetical protein